MIGLIFNRNKCGNHHWGNWKPTGERRMVKQGLSKQRLVLQRQQRRRCLHECDASETRYESVGSIDRRALEALAGRETSQQRAVKDVVEAIDGISGRPVDDENREEFQNNLQYALEKMLYSGNPITQELPVRISVELSGPAVKDDDE